MDAAAWVEFDDAEYHTFWDRIDDQFEFQPSIHPEDFPSFLEPLGSVTWRYVIDGRHPYESLEVPVNEALGAALQAATPRGMRVAALDWQHASYWVDPRLLVADPDWLIPALPDGDYSLYVAEDLRFGWLAHPWEQSICVFGGLLPHVRTFLDARDWPVIREDGRRRRHLRLV